MASRSWKCPIPYGWIWLGLIIFAWGLVSIGFNVGAFLFHLAIGTAHAGEANATLAVSATVAERPVEIQTPDEAEGVTITGEEIAAWCQEFGLFTGECLVDPGEVRAWFDEDDNPIEE